MSYVLKYCDGRYIFLVWSAAFCFTFKGKNAQAQVIIDNYSNMSSFLFLFSLVQKILEHVITAVPEAGLQVLPMATVLACNLVKASSDFEAAKENGQSAVLFIAKLSKIIAAEVPGACKDLKQLSWKDLPLIPDKEEIKKPSEYVLERYEKTEKNN